MTALLLYRAPSLPSRDEVIAWLLDRECTRLEVHQGPDGLWRGSGSAPVVVRAEAA